MFKFYNISLGIGTKSITAPERNALKDINRDFVWAVVLLF